MDGRTAYGTLGLGRDATPERWMDFEPTADRWLLSASDSGDISIATLYFQNVTPDVQGKHSVDGIDGGEFEWGYWETGTEVASPSGETEALDTPVAMVTASDEIDVGDIRTTLANGIVSSGDKLRFDWAGGTALIPADDGQGPPIGIVADGSFVELKNYSALTNGIRVMLELDAVGDNGNQNLSANVFGSDLDGFPIDSIDLDPGNCSESNCIFDQGELRGRYVGPDAQAIMSLIQARSGDDVSYQGVGVFEQGDVEPIFPEPVRIDPPDKDKFRADSFDDEWPTECVESCPG